MGTHLTNGEIEQAVRLRVIEHKYWKLIAAKLDCSRTTLWAARKTDEWQEAALRVIEEIKAEAFPTAWEGLLKAAQQGDVSACREILNRVEEVVPDELHITDDSDPLTELNRRITRIATRIGEAEDTE